MVEYETSNIKYSFKSNFLLFKLSISSFIVAERVVQENL